jgi:tight adherence protein B
MGLLVGLALGVGALLILLALTDDAGHSLRPARRSSLAELIAASGMDGVTPRGIVATSLALAVVVGASFVVLTATWPVSLAFALIAGAVPTVLVRQRAQRRRHRRNRGHRPR